MALSSFIENCMEIKSTFSHRGKGTGLTNFICFAALLVQTTLPLWFYCTKSNLDRVYSSSQNKVPITYRLVTD